MFNCLSKTVYAFGKTYVTDRTVKSYKEAIVPQVIINDLSNTKNDEVIKAACNWIRENKIF
ncbi:hypothetical protein [Paenimyroides aestuarii]|uniref:Uncharacterized protein n=1 Tax=Paenimyroides aestuarii TaxID=2968490 RepID=A0ABY5NQP5_9FLAO|nr:hypothetical protein [Paenimyroides aestuarii]UUV20887.1 hypothetical protein NPX36_11235 [Paenimyroides aestuarii]